MESRNSSGEQFGLKGLDNIINYLTPSDDSIEKFQSEFRAFTDNHFEDDVSLILIKVL